jgi:hypothetical protein
MQDVFQPPESQFNTALATSDQPPHRQNEPAVVLHYQYHSEVTENFFLFVFVWQLGFVLKPAGQVCPMYQELDHHIDLTFDTPVTVGLNSEQLMFLWEITGAIVGHFSRDPTPTMRDNPLSTSCYYSCYLLLLVSSFLTPSVLLPCFQSLPTSSSGTLAP